MEEQYNEEHYSEYQGYETDPALQNHNGGAYSGYPGNMGNPGGGRPRQGGGRFAAGFLTGSFCTMFVLAFVIGFMGIASGRFRISGILPSPKPGTENAAGQPASGTGNGQTGDGQAAAGNVQEGQDGSDLLAPGTAAFADKFSRKIAEINTVIDSVFIFPVDEDKMLDTAVKGYVNGLNDIYSVYMTPEEYKDTLNDSDGSYVGIGVVVQQDQKTNAVNVLTVYPDSPAEAGGVQKGDIIIKVEGEDIASWDLSDVVSAIRGEPGTEVNITVYREGDEIDISMIRKSLDKITVESEMLEDNVGYIKLTEFDNVSVEQMRTAVKDLNAKGMQTLVLDLRDNPGGLLTSVVDIADDFLPQANILKIEDKAGNVSSFDSAQPQLYSGPMVVLINGNSASASEVLSGALKDNGRAVLVGEQSFGKGIVQTFYQLSDGSGVKLTTAHYATPSGADIHGVGIAPDIEMKDDTETEEDEQLVRAVEEAGKLK